MKPNEIAANAQTSFTATGWVNQVLTPGMFYSNALGQMLYRAGVQTLRVQGSDARVTGQALIITDAAFNGDGGHTFFWATNTVQLPAENVTLYMALTRDGSNLIITTRVVDKANQNAVVFERSFVDTPGVDASLTAAQTAAFPELAIAPGAGAPDPGPPLLSGAQKGVGVFQRNSGGQPPVDAIWDNFSLRLHDVPPLNIARAVRLSWPASDTLHYAVESAPTLQGPWLPWQDLPLPGRQQVIIPTSEPAKFFRLRQAP